MKKKCLLVIDVQNDFCDGSLAVDGSLEIIDGINLLCKKFELVVATKDWHPANHKSFATHYNKKVGEVINLAGIKQVLWPEHCIQNTKGADFYPDLKKKYFKKIFYKGANPKIDSYSAFYSLDRKHSTGLSTWLKKNKIKQVFMVGLATDYCVKFSALDALKDGFSVVVIRDLCRAVNINKNDEKDAIDLMAMHQAKIIHYNQLKF